MRYVMKQKILCLGDDFIIRDQAGREVYYVDGKVFSIRDSLSFQDMNGHELATIRQRLLAAKLVLRAPLDRDANFFLFAMHNRCIGEAKE